MKKISLILILVSFIFGYNLDITIKNNKVANGRCFLLKSNENSFTKHYAVFNHKRYKFFKTKNDTKHLYYALIPVNYYTKPHKDKIIAVVQRGDKKYYKRFNVQIVDGKYKIEKLRVAPSKAHFSKEALKRIARESREAKKICNTITPYSFWSKKFIYPMKSKITSSFGNRRVFNGSLKSYHSGTDFRAKTGTLIRAVNDGKVVLVKNRFFAGNSVIINHGEGIYTGYYHMSKFKVKRGQIVNQGDILGLAGATGRVTGPHLHFSARVWGIQVDPLQLLKLLNQI